MDAEKINLESECLLYTINTPKDVVLNLKMGRRLQDADFEILLPEGMSFSADEVFVNIIGRGEVPLKKLHEQSAGRTGIGYERIVGCGAVLTDEGLPKIVLHELDLRPDNGIDVQMRIKNTVFEKEGVYTFSVKGTGREYEKEIPGQAEIVINVVSAVSDFKRVIKRSHVYDTKTDYRKATFGFTKPKEAERVVLLHSEDMGENWKVFQELEKDASKVCVHNLTPDKEHWFCLKVTGGKNEGCSNIAKVYSGMYNVRKKGEAPTDGSDASPWINKAVEYMHKLGGGTVLFEGGCFSATTIYLKSNVYLYIDKTARISALRGCDDEEKAWFSDAEYRTDTSHMSGAAYLTPENWMTKQDCGHSYFCNALFVGQRIDNVKIIGNGRIDGEENLTKSNDVMEYESGSRADKMVALKLCTNFEMGGLSIGKDLWYAETENPNEDEPFYLDDEGNDSKCGTDNMLRISNGGHFVVLATGVDGISTHDIYVEKGSQVRDVFDYMGCNDISAFNIYVEGASDDIIKLGSDCSLGFTRPSKNCIVRNVIGDTSCNLFQIGSETADDIQDVCIDNIYVLASDKAGFSISVNDGGHIRNIHLNCGGSIGQCRCGIKHERVGTGYSPTAANPRKSVMRRIRTPLFISLSNRGRVIGARAVEKKFTDDTGVCREELLVTNVPIGRIENVFLRNLDVKEVYRASQAKSPDKSRWPSYEGQARTTAMIVGYKIADDAKMTLPDGKKSRDIENVVLEEIDLTVKGGNPLSDTENTPRELGVGQFNLRNLAEDDRGSKIPAYGYYIRHVNGIIIRKCKVLFEENDDRYAIVTEDAKNVKIENLTAEESDNNKKIIHMR